MELWVTQKMKMIREKLTTYVVAITIVMENKNKENNSISPSMGITSLS